jgi:hypothetical protein
MKVFFFEPYAIAVPHYETALELIQGHIDGGDDVSFFYCSASLNACEANYRHSLFTCLQCVSRRTNGLKLISGGDKLTLRSFLDLSAEETSFIRNYSIEFASIKELKAYKVDEADIGMGVASSVISFLRDPEPDLVKHKTIVNRFLKSALKVYYSFKRILERERPGLVYLFNGRFSNIRPVLRLCERYSIEYRIHERASSKEKFQLAKNHLPHDFMEFQKLVEQYWKDSESQDRVGVASRFFENRKNGYEQAWFSFTANHKKGKLPEEWDERMHNVVVFNSSEDEFAAIGDTFSGGLFKNQLEGVRFLAANMSDIPNTVVYVRMHPNLKGVKNKSVEDLFEIAGLNFHIIPPESDISTYQLLDSADKVVTFGSTIGIEATYWNKPSILLGNAFYRDLGSTYNPSSSGEVISLLQSDLAAKPKEGAIKYGFYVSSYGIEYKLYNAHELFNGEFNGTKIKPSKWVKRFFNKPGISNVLKYLSRVHADKF